MYILCRRWYIHNIRRVYYYDRHNLCVCVVLLLLLRNDNSQLHYKSDRYDFQVACNNRHNKKKIEWVWWERWRNKKTTMDVLLFKKEVKKLVCLVSFFPLLTCSFYYYTAKNAKRNSFSQFVLLIPFLRDDRTALFATIEPAAVLATPYNLWNVTGLLLL